MIKRVFVFICLLPPVFLLTITIVEAQQTARERPRLGFLWASTGPEPNSRAGIHQGLRGFGYIEGQNIAIVYRYAKGKFERLPVLAAELVRLKVDVIVTGGSTATRAAKEATSTIPIVMLQDNDPVGSGFVASLARPGGNVTGLSTLRPEISGKRLELLTEIVPKLSRVAILGASDNPGNAQALNETELAAGVFKVQLQYLDIRSRNDVEPAFQEARKSHADAVLELGGPRTECLPNRAFRPRGKESAPSGMGEAKLCRSGRPHVLRGRNGRFGAPRGYLR